MKKKGKVLTFRYFLYDLIRITAALPGVIWFRTKKLYESKAAKKRIKGAALIVSNHVSFYDPVYLMIGLWRRRIHFVAHKSFFEGRRGRMFRAFQCIPIDREGVDVECLRKVKDRLDDKRIVTIFPEGHVNLGEGQDELKAFKSGMILMAMRSRCPIVPVYIVRKKKWYSRLKMVMGEPVDVMDYLKAGASLENIDKAARAVFEKEEILKGIYEERYHVKEKDNDKTGV